MFMIDTDIHDFYEANDEDMRLKRGNVNKIEFLTTVKYLQEVCPQGSKILDACAGTGIYAFELAKRGYRVTAGDLVVHNVAEMIRHQENDPILERIYTGSILDLSFFADESFDVVLNFGAFYHLIDAEDRMKAVKESLRVLKPEGVYCLAYLNRYANIIKFIDQLQANFDAFDVYLNNGYTEGNNLFYASSPEEVEVFMQDFGIQPIHNIATDGLKFVIRNTINSLTDEEFTKWLSIHYQMCEIKSLLGYSEHALYIGRKKRAQQN